MVSMLNQAAVDALCSAAYLENYLDCVDDLPNDLQRTVTMLRELDCVTNGTCITLINKAYSVLGIIKRNVICMDEHTFVLQF